MIIVKVSEIESYKYNWLDLKNVKNRLAISLTGKIKRFSSFLWKFSRIFVSKLLTALVILPSSWSILSILSEKIVRLKYLHKRRSLVESGDRVARKSDRLDQSGSLLAFGQNDTLLYLYNTEGNHTVESPCTGRSYVALGRQNMDPFFCIFL